MMFMSHRISKNDLVNSNTKSFAYKGKMITYLHCAFYECTLVKQSS